MYAIRSYYARRGRLGNPGSFGDHVGGSAGSVKGSGRSQTAECRGSGQQGVDPQGEWPDRLRFIGARGQYGGPVTPGQGHQRFGQAGLADAGFAA